MVGRIQPIILCKPSIMRVLGLNNVGRAVKTDPTLLRYASAITEQKKCWELLAQKFDGFQTLRNNSQQHPTTRNRVCKRTQHVTSNNVASVCTRLNVMSRASLVLSSACGASCQDEILKLQPITIKQILRRSSSLYLEWKIELHVLVQKSYIYRH